MKSLEADGKFEHEENEKLGFQSFGAHFCEVKIDPDLPLFDIRTMDQNLAQQRWPFRVFGTMFAIFALIALVLSAVGLYAVTAYSVTQRTQEIGVRMALGAGARQVAWMILQRGLVQLESCRSIKVSDCEITGSGRNGIVCIAVDGEIIDTVLTEIADVAIHSLDARGLT